MRYLHDVSSTSDAMSREMRHATHRQSASGEPHDHRRFHDEATYSQLLGDTKAFIEFVLAFILSMGFQLTHKSTCDGGGSLTRHSHYACVRLGGLTMWRIQCTRCRAVFTVRPHFILRYRKMRPDAAHGALLATHGGLSLEWCATLCHLSPMALYRLICALGRHSLVSVWLK